ncbi:MAG: plasmid pRiA4b ORF-3 family protein [Lewinella sp.]|uniref:plasmid pRiA4b ORF-3 family protein n=1 Tax=Lewinella sp. TaxID=2004506 RepID=UPI003D6A7EDF
MKIYQLKITLQGSSKPPIWRQILVASTINFQELHAIIQGAMGWTNSHLHAFTDSRRNFFIGIPDNSGMMDVTDGRTKKINTLLKKEKDHVLYEYDFGDGWIHTIELQKILPVDDKLRYPYLLKGKGSCPPEDCGGIWGYYNMVEAINDPKHPEHEDLVEWTGLEYWDVNEVDLELHREETWDAFDNAKGFYGMMF